MTEISPITPDGFIKSELANETGPDYDDEVISTQGIYVKWIRTEESFIKWGTF